VGPVTKSLEKATTSDVLDGVPLLTTVAMITPAPVEPGAVSVLLIDTDMPFGSVAPVPVYVIWKSVVVLVAKVKSAACTTPEDEMMLGLVASQVAPTSWNSIVSPERKVTGPASVITKPLCALMGIAVGRAAKVCASAKLGTNVRARVTRPARNI